MKTVFTVLLLLVLFACIGIIYRFFYVSKNQQKLSRKKFKNFEGLIIKLTNNQPITHDDIIPLAKDPSTRHALYGILDRFHHTHLFPEEYFTLEKSAESFLVNWLEFPTELNATPDKIDLFTKIQLPDNPSIEYFVFKFKKLPGGYGFTNEWMWGVVGPFDEQSKPYEIPKRIFSRFNAPGAVSALEEVRWVHDNINKS